jgi:tetratricopeptide (TPR) repeat protein
VLRRQYKLDESEAVFRRFVARQTTMLGKDHFLVGRAYNNLATLLRTKGDYPAAEQALLEALRIYSSSREPDQLDQAISHHNLGGVYREAGELTKALEQLNEAIELKRNKTGPGSPQLVSSLLEKAAALREQGNLSAAKGSFDEAQRIAAQRFDRTDRRHAFVILERGRLNAAMGNQPAATEDLQSAIASLREQEEPGRLAEALCALADVRSSTGNTAEARELLREAITLRKKVMPASHPALAASQRQLNTLTSR